MLILNQPNLTSIPIPELELQAVEFELELQIEDSISIPPSILFIFPVLSSVKMPVMHTDALKIVKVFCKERICFKTSYCKKFSVIEL